MKTRALLLTALAGAFALACGAPSEEDIESGEGAVAAETDIYGNDRVGAVLKGHPEKIPAELTGFEKLFGIGRECRRVDSKEIFVVEESQTRLAGPKELHEQTATKLMPRAVITGCNVERAADHRKSFSLMAALISDTGMHAAAAGDTMRLWPLEVMALDDTTGLYNFYVFEPAVAPSDPWAVLPPETPGRVTRVYRAIEERVGRAGYGQFNVFQKRLESGKPVTAQAQPIGGGNRCFNCHVNGGPLMNEMGDPWTNWVSFKKTLPSATLSGTTKQLVDEAVPNTTTGRASLANDLEPIMRAATQAYVFGKTRSNGWARATVEGKLPGGVPEMLESLFCETELAYTSASQSLPLELFLDPDAANPAGVTAPASFGDDKLPFQFPIRSSRDRETESWLIQKGYVAASTVMALRLVDDENDIFSPARCGILPDVVRDLPTEPAQIGEKIRTTVLAKVDALRVQPKRLAYIRSLLTPGIRREVAQREYLAELTARYEAMPKTDQAVRTKERFRKARAREKFSGKSNPLPILDAR